MEQPTAAAALHAAMHGLGVSHVEFARLVGVSPRSITRWTRGSGLRTGSRAAIVRRVAKRDENVALALARALHVDPPASISAQSPARSPLAAHLAAELLIASERMDVPPRALRKAVARVLAAAAAAQWPAAAMHAALRELERESTDARAELAADKSRAR